MPLTGRFSFRRTLFGKVVMTVEEEVKGFWPMARNGASRRRWRDATLWDLTHPELRRILDLRDTAPHDPSKLAQPSSTAPTRKTKEVWDGAAWLSPGVNSSGIRLTHGH